MKFPTISFARRPRRGRFSSAVAMGAASVLMVAGVSLLASSPASATGAGTLTVTTTASPGSTAVVGTQVTIIATLSGESPSGTPTGTVTFEYSTGGTYSAVTGCTNPVTLSGSTATCVTTALPADTADLESSYSGDSTFAFVTSSADPYSVYAAGSGTGDATSLSTSPAVSVAVGNQVGITVTVAPVGTPSGTVTFEYSTGGTYSAVTGCTNPTTLASGSDTCTTSSLPLGTRYVEANYTGDATYEASSMVISFAVTPGPGTNSVLLSVLPASPVSVGSTVYMTADVIAGSPSGTPTGTVTFEYSTGSSYSVVPGCTNPATTSSGIATCDTSGLPFGTEYLEAAYSGNATYNAATSAVVSYFVRTTSVTSITVTPVSPVSYSTSVTLTSIVTTGATGTVNFETSQNGVTFVSISGCSAQAVSVLYTTSCTTTTLPAGTNYLEAVYSGNSIYAPSTSSTIYYVIHQATQVALTFTSTAGLLGTPLTLKVNGGSGTGALTFVVANGTATGCAITGSTLKVATAGTCIVTATKASDTNYLVLSSPATTVTFVNPIPRAIRVIGAPYVGRMVVIGIAGQYFYGQPTIKSNVAGVVAKVSKDTGSLLSVQVSVKGGTKVGVHVFTLTFKNGQTTSVRFNLR